MSHMKGGKNLERDPNTNMSQVWPAKSVTEKYQPIKHIIDSHVSGFIFWVMCAPLSSRSAIIDLSTTSWGTDLQ